MTHSKLTRCVVTLVVGVVLLAGCSIDGGSVVAATKPTLPPPVQGDADAVAAAVESAGAPAEAEVAEVAPTGVVFEVLSIDNAFAPEVATIAAGTEVLWTNRGQNPHNIVTEPEGGEWEIEDEIFLPGAQHTAVFTRPGVYRYFCSIHGNIDLGMPGVIIVE